MDVADFIRLNRTEYTGDDHFLVGPTQATERLWQQILQLTNEERQRGGVYAVDAKTPSTILSHDAGYLDPSLEKIVGLQTDEPFKRSIHSNGGIRMVNDALAAYGFEADETVTKTFSEYRKTHNQGVFDAYTPEMRAARKAGIITGLPGAYGRGRIIGDYRRVALYGTARLIEERKQDLKARGGFLSESMIRDREEMNEQLRALTELTELGTRYGFDLSRPAETAQEAFQWVYLAYLAAIREQNGAAMSLGRVSTFLDMYVERDLATGRLTEETAQELVDHFVMKLRIVKFLRTPDYIDLFSGDPTWVTESIGGMSEDGRSNVTKSSIRFLHTLSTLGPAPEPNLTVLWSTQRPRGFKEFCAKMSIVSSSIQYENDDLMLPVYGDDYGIACCVSAMRIGKQMQIFGARANLAKALLYTINGGMDEKLKIQVAPASPLMLDEVLDYETVMAA
jgi:formate C-acetyltransferase